MKALVTRLLVDGKSEKVLVTNWQDVGKPVGNQVKTRTLYSGITNGTECNNLIGGNYANRDKDLPRGWGYKNVGKEIYDTLRDRPNDLLGTVFQ